MPTSTTLRRIPLTPLVGLGIVSVAVVAAILLSWGVARANRWVSHSVRVQIGIVEVGERLSAYDSAYRGYLIRGNPAVLPEADAALRDLVGRIDQLRRDVADDPVQTARLDRIVPLLRARLAEARTMTALRPHLDMTQLGERANVARGPQLMSAIRRGLATMFEGEERLRSLRQTRTELLTWGLAVGLAGAVVLVVLVAYLTIADATARYAELERAHAETSAEMAGREAAESRMRQMHKMETIGQLTGGIAHDFNNMLAVIVGSLDMAQRAEPADPTRVRHNVATALDGAERAAALVSRLLAFSRLQPLSPVPIDVNGLVDSMGELLSRTLGERITVRTVPADGLWPCFADPGQLENAILNLAVNARDAMDAADGRLTITTANETVGPGRRTAEREEWAPGDYVTIRVADTGSGMSDEVIRRAFDPFFTTKEVGKGTGLGLSQVFGFVKQSGGHVAIDSIVGQGTSVSLHLPRHAGAVAPRTGPAQLPSPAGDRHEIVLVVEDEPHVRAVSTEALSELGYSVLAAADGEQAMRILHEQPDVALVFTDMVMPGMSGRMLGEAARRFRPDLPVLYTTGYARGEDDANWPVEGALLRKPFTVAQLAARVRQALDTGVRASL